MSYIAGDIATRVQTRLKDTGYSTTTIIGFINDTQNDVFNEYSLPFMETTQNYTLAAGTSDLTNGAGLPTDYVQAIDIFLTSTGFEKLLQYKTFNELDATFPDVTDTTIHAPGVPDYFYNYGQTLRLFPVPASAYTATLRYVKRPTALTSTSDVPSIPSEFEELLVEGACWRVLQSKDNYDQAAIHENKYMEHLQKLVNRYSQRQSGQVTTMRINRSAVGKTNY